MRVTPEKLRYATRQNYQERVKGRMFQCKNDGFYRAKTFQKSPVDSLT